MGSRRHNRAFTLLEVMAAAAIIGFSLVVLLGSQAAAVRNTQRIIRQAQALAVAEAAMDEFLAQPAFEADGNRQFTEQEVEVEIPGYSGDPQRAPFRVFRITAQRDPYMDQEYLDVYTEDEEDASLLLETEEEADEEEEEEFDPGLFVSVRIEVRDTAGDKVLAALVTWLPKPRIEEDQREDEEATTP
ncbi:MAG: prepilin-type N-terminal cleavage/methylation domain-containing protein [Phycisphaerae bacterium]|nr:prepilin-type N-terminal cleavage/methylation domain-containing protein [Phycisphaerae bacterium]